ncbi:hypothetical protein AD006_30185 (plasmid) [Pseudonocardia sp. EC080610-09]|uniref:hypothetical protein n=1 Tax=unclassified Pseudonocardia TaxID=2619320 RepID=UPI0007061665|nr:MULTISPECIES: hypothetical protein [unclassified Pseudonocardia]ALL79507.1 hypothetical protein AD006_30185 [Pseudonocardia sp. EC080610-09]ALL85541.1 hypothetical protein AD017_31065 [Pseudonocardia sp. EC080619-01]
MTTLLVALQLLVLVVLAVLILTVARARYRENTVPDLSPAALRLGVVAVLFGVVLGWVLPAMAPAVVVPMSAKLWAPLICLVLALLTAAWLRAEARPGGQSERNELLHRFNRRRLPRRDVR